MDDVWRHRMGSALVVLFCLGFVVCVAYLSLRPKLLGGAYPPRVTMDINLDNNWVTEDGTHVDMYNLNKIPGFAENGAVVMCGMPREIQADSEFNFISTNVTVRVYYDNEAVYIYDPDPNVFGHPYISHFNFVTLSPDDAEKIIRLELKPVYSNSNAKITNIRLSGTVPYIQKYVCNHGFPFLESLLIMFIGMAVIVLHIALRNQHQLDLDLLSLGAISVLLGIWSGSVTLVFQLITGLAPISTALEYMSLLFVAYPVVRFAGALLHPRHRERYELAARVAALVSIGLSMALTFAFDCDMHQLLPISHAQLVLCGILVFMQAISSFRRHGRSLVRGSMRSNRAIMIAFLIFMACSVTDFVLFRVSSIDVLDSAFFMRHGLFAFSMVLAIEAFRTSMSYMRRAERAEAVEAVAYVDALTGIGNRSAWKAMRIEMDEALKTEQIDDALVCQFDVNYLKKINDTYGHAEGDDLIKRAADTINRSFGTEGVCYRTGGDEFTAILVGVMLEERLHMCYDLFLQSVDEQQEQHAASGKEVPFSLAVGFACASETDKGTIKAAQALADKRMYVNKRMMKAERQD